MKGTITFCLLFSFTTFFNMLYAQRTISGTVTDAETGETLVGAYIVIRSMKLGTVTDTDGKYSLELPLNITKINCNYVGFEEQEILVDSSNIINIRLREQKIICVEGSYVVSRPSTTQIQSQNFHQGIFADPLQLIQGKVAGLTIVPNSGNPNEPLQVRLRGLTTLSQKATPLIVIDGIPNGDLSLIDPNDIASFEILKDGAAAAIYGMQGSAGVILVTTKSGNATEKPTVTYSGSIGTAQISRKLEMMTATEFKQLNDNITNPWSKVLDSGADTDWLSTITRKNAINQRHHLALNGENHHFAIHYKEIEGTQLKTGFQQYGANATFTQKALHDKLMLTTQLQLTSRNKNLGFDEAFRYAAIFNPTAPSGKQTDPEYAQWDGYYQKNNFDSYNPQAIVEQNSNTGRDNFFNANLRLDYEVLDGFKLGAVYSDRHKSSTGNEYYSKFSRFRGSDYNGLAVQNNNVTRQQYYETTANYTKKINNLDIQAVAGYNWIDRATFGKEIQAGNFLTDATGADALAASLDVKNGLARITNYHQSDRLIAGFGRMSLDYKDTYFLQGSIRKEGSSRLGSNEKFAWFPSVSAGVVLTNVMTIPKVSYLKIRAGYGVTGGNPNQNYLSLQRIGELSSSYQNGEYRPSYGAVGGNENPNLKCEIKKELNIGVQAQLFNNRIHASFDYYNRSMTDLLKSNPVPMPPNLSYFTWQNVAALHSTGIEATTSMTLIKKANTTWTSAFTFSQYNTTFTALNPDGGVEYEGNLGAPGMGSYQYVRIKVGEKVGNFFGAVVKGMGGGKIMYDDGMGGTTDDVTKVPFSAFRIIGNGMPKGELSWINTLTRKRFDLNLDVQSIFGHNKVNAYRVFYEVGDNVGWNQIKTKYYVGGLRDASAFSSRYVENASFVKIANVSLGYTLPIQKGNLRVSLTAIDPVYFTGYTGVNPNPTFEDKGSLDQGSRFVNPNNLLVIGVDRRHVYFLQRSYSLNVVAKF